ncbi:MAG TPA: hypothetical protein VIZ43_19260, partial [Trebonia sp.]
MTCRAQNMTTSMYHAMMISSASPMMQTCISIAMGWVPYAYRHSYAQRHADAGVQPDVLRELMSHRSMRTTTGYYRITENRLRAAVDKVARHQLNAAGQRVFTSIAGLLAVEHARMRVGQVAVPFGVCTEPSNVKAGGHACPYKYTCTGCGHFRSDPSYLPELKSYLQQLLAD